MSSILNECHVCHVNLAMDHVVYYLLRQIHGQNFSYLARS